MGIKGRLKVVKADGSVEEYLHTKVIGTISSALAGIDQPDTSVAEELAEVITYFIYNGRHRKTITSGEIFSITKAGLAAVRYEEAAIALSEHHYQRKLKRSRIEVVSVDVRRLADAEKLRRSQQSNHSSRWDKSIIVDDLVGEYNICRQTARTIASMVEERIFGMGVTLVSTSLIRQLVLSDTAAVLRAHQQLQTA